MVSFTIQINAPNHALDQDLLPIELPPSATIKDLKTTINSGTGFEISQLQFYLNGQPLLTDTQTLEAVGVRDGELLAMLVREDMPPSGAPQQNPHSQSRGVRQQSSNRPSGITDEQIETVRLRILGSDAAVQQVSQQHPQMATAIQDPVRFRELYLSMQQEENTRERERREQMQLLNEDPFNVEAQAKIEEMIRQDRVMENLEYAYEHNPEVFGHVHMLYINTKVNGRNVKAFVDSGAQTTIMSPSCAEACGIMRLIDKRYSGVARGVGTAKILGRVHSADISIGNSVMPCSFTVMEGKDVDLLLGLDMLKRYQATIDLRRNKLVFENNEVDFLPENEIPKWSEDNEPVIKGPDGTEIGAQSGTVKSAGSTDPSSGNFKGSGQTLGGSASSSAVPQPTVQSTPAAAQPSGTAAPSQSSASHPAEKIDQLQGLGFSRQEAISALDATGGNVEYAAGLLFQG
ncbi:hypothetical protein AAFC00_002440 [Neodothiora populina]|uniref:DNA damage-inducible protein 1 n=1 Tax=Neodothiora populina TaxID=2781224 RepID=A0ABR3P8G4_9PEZI